jgi:hypothetical protein
MQLLACVMIRTMLQQQQLHDAFLMLSMRETQFMDVRAVTMQTVTCRQLQVILVIMLHTQIQPICGR